MKNSRRQFLRSCGTAALSAPLARLGMVSANAQTASGYRALVCVFLFGGNDANNTIVPLNGGLYDQYRTARGSVALASNTLLGINSPAQGAFGLHPNLTGIRDLYAQGKAAVVLNVGTLIAPVTKSDLNNSARVPRNLYSHSDQQAQWQAGNAAGAGTGWGGRAADAVRLLNPGAFPPGVSVSGSAALQLVGSQTRPVNVSPGSSLGLSSLNNTDADKIRETAYPQVLTFSSGASLIGAADNVVKAGLESARQINAALAGAPALNTVLPNTGLGNQLREVARIISVRSALGMNRQIFFVSMGGFDNHSDLLPQQAGLLQTVSAAMAAFYQATVELNVASSVTAFTETEFNRTMGPNGTVGTDHAWGGHQIVVGGAVRADVYGRMPNFTLGGPDDAGNRGLWIPSYAMDQYGATLAQWFGVAAADLNSVFPNLVNFPLKNIGFLS